MQLTRTQRQLLKQLPDEDQIDRLTGRNLKSVREYKAAGSLTVRGLARYVKGLWYRTAAGRAAVAKEE